MRKQLFKSMLLLCALIVGSSNVWADHVLYYTLDGTVTTANNSYAQDGGGLENNGMDWSVTGNTSVSPWRIGGQSLSEVDRVAYSKTAMGTAITKIELDLGDITLTAVNSITLIVASDADFSTVIETIEETSITASTTLTFTPTAPATEWATGAYYKFVFNVTASGSKNKYVQLTSAKFYESGNVPTHTATFSVNGETTSTDFSEDADIVFPADPADVNGKKFVGWTATPIVGTTDVKPAFADAAKMGSSDVTYYAVFADAAIITGTFTDNFELETTGVSGTTYTNWSGITAADGSDAVYSGNSAGGNSSIQLRSSGNNSGIVSTTTGGTIKKVVVEWNSNTVNGRTLDIYGSTTAYTGATDLYNDNAGTKLGSVVYGTSTELSITGNYQYIGLRSYSSTMYLNKISIDWEGEATTYSGYCTTVAAAEPEAYTVTMKEGTEDADNWTITPEEAKTTGVAAGTEITATYSGTKLVKSVKAVKKETDLLSGVFSVSASKKVNFSKGNLRYASSKWSFFDNQYDYYTSYSADAWDKFGWSTSATTYGMNTSTDNATYSGDFVDWGATMGTGWFTLSSDEWTYLLNTRTASIVGGTTDGRYAKAKVNDVQGIILFPDTYTHPDGVTPPTGVNAEDVTGWNGNDYSSADWTKMESAGCVFLPAAGCRNGSSVNYPGAGGYYLSATPNGTANAYCVYFSSDYLYPATYGSRFRGCSVRLVQEVAPTY